MTYYTAPGLIDINIDPLENIVKEVSKYCDIPVNILQSTKKTEDLVFARHLIFYLSRKLPKKIPLARTGKMFSRDHTTVLYGYQKITEQLSPKVRDDETITALNAVCKKLMLKIYIPERRSEVKATVPVKEVKPPAVYANNPFNS